MAIFNSYVSLPEGKCGCSFDPTPHQVDRGWFCRLPLSWWFMMAASQIPSSSKFPPQCQHLFCQRVTENVYIEALLLLVFLLPHLQGHPLFLFYSDFFSKAKGNLMGEQVAVAFQPEQLLRLSTESGDVSAVRTIMDNLSIPLTKTQERLELKPKRTKRLA